MTIENIIITIFVGLFVGVSLLIIEHKTSWFKNRITQVKNDSLELGVASVTSMNDLDNLVGDWLQITKEIQEILEDLHCSNELEHGDYIPSVEFSEIRSIRNSPDKEICFDITTNFTASFERCVRTEPSGRIVSYTYS